MTLVIHKSKGLTPEILAELKALAAMPDDTIDLSDMPEVTDFTGWVRGKFYRPVKKQVTLRLDADLIEWFKDTTRRRAGVSDKDQRSTAQSG